MKKSYRSMSLVELDSLVRERGLKRPLSLGGLKAVARPTRQDIQARQEMVDSLEEYDHKKPSLKKFWPYFIGVVSVAISILGLVSSL